MSMKMTVALCAVAVVIGVQGQAGAGDNSYVGANKCKLCHSGQHKSWKASKMANAFDLLKPGNAGEAKTKAKLDPAKDYTKDTACLPCHVTGWGKPGGFKSIEQTPELAGVGCESCHGPASAYLAEDKMSNKNKEYKRADIESAGLVSKPTKETCLQCHNEKSPFVGKNYTFDFQKRKDQGTHAHTPLKYPHE